MSGLADSIFTLSIVLALLQIANRLGEIRDALEGDSDDETD